MADSALDEWISKKSWKIDLECEPKIDLREEQAKQIITEDSLMKTTLVRMITLVYWIPISAHTTYIARVLCSMKFI